MPDTTPSGSDPASAPAPVHIGLVADTHVGEWTPGLPQAVLDALAGVDLILHAGDLTDLAVLDRLAEVAPVLAVQGDHDRAAGIVLPRSRVVAIGGRRIGLTHGRRAKPLELALGILSVVRRGPVLPGLHRRLRSRFGAVDVIVYGHLHLADERWEDGVLFVNPGAVHNAERAPGFAAGGFASRRYLRFRQSLPHDRAAPSVAILTLTGEGMSVRFVPIEVSGAAGSTAHGD